MDFLVKLAKLIIVLSLVLGLVACTGAATPTTAPATPTTAPAQATEPAAVAATEAPAAAATEAPADTSAAAPVTLRYANWNLGTEEENNLQRQLIAAYQELHPNVTIEVVDMSGEGGWDAILTSYAAKGELPDVFMANNMPLYVKNGWLASLNELVKEDADWKDVPQVLKDAFTYGDMVYGMPAAQFVMGYFVNKDLFDAANLDAPEYGVSVDDFFKAATALNNVEKGVLGLDEMEFMEGWYPSTQDSMLKWFSFDGEKMNYNSAAFKAGIAKTGEMQPYTWQGLTDEQKTKFKSQGPWELFLNQEVGVRWDAAWAAPGYIQNATFDWDFIGIPGGNQALATDVMVISKTATNVQEAYNFAKWMSFSKEAYAKEAELTKAMGSAPKMPVSIDADSIALYKTFVDKPGLLAALDNLDNSLIESLAKIVPGYINARWEGKPGIDIGDDKDVNMGFMFANATSGRFKYEDYAAQLETFANKTLADAAAEVNK